MQQKNTTIQRRRPGDGHISINDFYIDVREPLCKRQAFSSQNKYLSAPPRAIANTNRLNVRQALTRIRSDSISG